jgi:hypothetical protein
MPATNWCRRLISSIFTVIAALLMLPLANALRPSRPPPRKSTRTLVKFSSIMMVICVIAPHSSLLCFVTSGFLGAGQSSLFEANAPLNMFRRVSVLDDFPTIKQIRAFNSRGVQVLLTPF